jgi:hypothetical protein
MPGAFFAWLETANPSAARQFKASGLPQSSSRLYVLLRACRRCNIRPAWVKGLHREWRKARTFKAFQITPDMVTPIPPSEIERLENLPGVSGSFEMTLDFKCPFCKGDGKIHACITIKDVEYEGNAVCPSCIGSGSAWR